MSSTRCSIGWVLTLACAAATAGMATPAGDAARDAGCGCSTDVDPRARERASCDTLEACIKALIAAAEAGGGISKTGQTVSEAVRSFGARAVPALLPLLEHQDPDVRELASYTLRDCEGLGEEHLDALIESRLRGDGWIPPAIARIGTPRAIAFLASELAKEPEPNTQLTWAFRMLGDAGTPYLNRLLECGAGCDGKVLAVVADILSNLGQGGEGAVDRLLVIAEDAQSDPETRRAAIQALGTFGAVAEPAVGRLKAIAAADRESFEEAVNQAVMGIGGPAADEARRAEAEALGRCHTEGTPEATRAMAALRALDERIRALQPADDPGPAAAELHSILGSRCFRLSAEQGDPPTFDHALSLQTWWEDGGGAWLASYVDRPRLGRVDDLRDNVVFPPKPRKVLALDTAPHHALAALLCRLDDADCGRETAGWAERARRAFAANAVESRRWDSDAFPVNHEALATRCQTSVGEGETPPDYRKWMACLEENRVRDWALPLGHFRSPRQGWLVIRGRRGHYEFCDELRAYDLATGAAYVAQSCSGLHLRRDGSVNFDDTDAARKAKVSVGSISAANLREAVWMILLAPEAEETQLRAAYFPIPKGMLPSLSQADGDRDLDSPWSWSSHWTWSSSQTQLAWWWVAADGRTLASGDLTWPSSHSAAETHAAHLLEVAEQGLVEGCPPAEIPALAPAASGPGVSAIDARRDDLTDLQRGLTDTLREYAASDACAAKPASRD